MLLILKKGKYLSIVCVLSLINICAYAQQPTRSFGALSSSYYKNKIAQLKAEKVAIKYTDKKNKLGSTN